MIHYVDKKGGERSEPVVNPPDTIEDGVGRMAHGTNSVNYHTPATINTNGPTILAGNARMVKSGVASVVVPSGNSGLVGLNTTTIALNLGYSPLAFASLNNAQINGGGAFNLALPLPLSLGNDTGGTGGVAEFLAISGYMQFATDATNFYVITFTSGSFVGATYQVTYYLYQQVASA